MKQIKEAKNIELFVNIKYEETDTLSQIFEFNVNNKKYLNYLLDQRLLFKDKINRLIKEFLLPDFISRIDDIDKVIIKYKKQKKPKPCIRKIQAYVPPYFGCKFCSKAEHKDGFAFCPEKNKHYPGDGVKRCPVFKTKEELLT